MASESKGSLCRKKTATRSSRAFSLINSSNLDFGLQLRNLVYDGCLEALQDRNGGLVFGLRVRLRVLVRRLFFEALRERLFFNLTLGLHKRLPQLRDLLRRLRLETLRRLSNLILGLRVRDRRSFRQIPDGSTLAAGFKKIGGTLPGGTIFGGGMLGGLLLNAGGTMVGGGMLGGTMIGGAMADGVAGIS